jgi:hypothetical protein
MEPFSQHRVVRLDRLVEAILEAHTTVFERVLALPSLRGAVDPVGVTALLHLLVSTRIATGIDELVLGVRLSPRRLEFALWDDGTPAPFPKVVHHLGSKVGATIRAASVVDGGLGITVSVARPARAKSAA